VNSRRLYRCRHDRPIAGVAAGIAEYLDIDPTLVRVLWILSAFFGGFTILLYIILAFVIPLEPLPVAGPNVDGGATTGPTIDDGTTTSPAAADGDPVAAAWTGPVAHEHSTRGESRVGLGLGVLLVVFGALALTGPLFPGWFAGVALGPTLIIALGVALVVVGTRRQAAAS
jgi:phage shock protein PspC (stress-responsive transcriptional regulator)